MAQVGIAYSVGTTNEIDSKAEPFQGLTEGELDALYWEDSPSPVTVTFDDGKSVVIADGILVTKVINGVGVPIAVISRNTHCIDARKDLWVLWDDSHKPDSNPFSAVATS